MNLSEKPIGAAATIATLLITVIDTIVTMLVAVGVVHWDTATQGAVIACAVALVNAACVIGPLVWAARHVTPRIAPRDEDGTPLVRVDSGAPTVTAQRAAIRAMGRHK